MELLERSRIQAELDDTYGRADPEHHARSYRHWLGVFVAIVLGTVADRCLHEANFMIDMDHALYARASSILPARRQVPRFTRLVVIDDDAFWGDKLKGRTPTDRKYLAALLNSIAKLQPAVIALDVDLRSSDPNKTVDPFPMETNALVEAVGSIARVPGWTAATDGGIPVVLARTLGVREQSYVHQADVYDTALPQPDALGRVDAAAMGKMGYGYLGLPYDSRIVPLGVPTNEGKMDSFALATAKAADPMRARDAKEKITEQSFPFGGYIDERQFFEDGYVCDATDLAHYLKLGEHGPEVDRDRGTGCGESLRSHVVLVGAYWHSLAHGVGAIADLHLTPVGTRIPGVFTHANFAEAILDDRLYWPAPAHLMDTLQLLFVVFVALLFTYSAHGLLAKVIWTLGICAALLVANYVTLRIFGIYFNAAVPVCAVALHAIGEEIHEWYRLAKRRGRHPAVAIDVETRWAASDT